MGNVNIIDIIKDLHSDNFVKQVEALDRFFGILPSLVSESEVEEVLRAAVEAFERSDNRYLVAQRLQRFGPRIVTTLAELLNRSQSSEVKTLASLILAGNGNLNGKDVLINEIAQGGNFRVLASVVLAKAGVRDHVPIIFQKLENYAMPPCNREFPDTEDSVVLTFLDGLKQLNVTIPENLRRKLSAPSSPKFLRQAL